MKYLTIITALFILSCSGEKRDSEIYYNSLSSAIIDGFLAKDGKYRKIELYTVREKGSIDFALRYSPMFLQTIRTVFNISDTSEIRKLLENSARLDTSVKTSVPNVLYINHLYSEEDSAVIDERKIRGGSAMEDLFILPTKNGNHCIARVHTIKNGTEIALLEKKNGKWKITSIQTEFIE